MSRGRQRRPYTPSERHREAPRDVQGRPVTPEPERPGAKNTRDASWGRSETPEPLKTPGWVAFAAVVAVGATSTVLPR